MASKSLLGLPSREQGLELLDALIAAYSVEKVQRRLQALWQASEGDELQWARFRQEVTLAVQGPIISTYGFEASRQGWAACMSFFSNLLRMGDTGIAERHQRLCYLLEPALQGEGPDLVLMQRGEPGCCEVADAAKLAARGQAPLALASHQGLAIVTAGASVQQGPWSVVALGVGPLERAIVASFDGIFLSSEGKVLDVEASHLVPGSSLNLVSGDGSDEAPTRWAIPGRMWTVNAQGAISPTLRPDLVLGVREPKAPPRVDAQDNVRGEGQIWAVVGGGAHGGLIVKVGSSLRSQALSARLTTGSRVEQLGKIVRERLHFRRIRGDGPDFGWVSLHCNGTPLLLRVTGHGLATHADLPVPQEGPPQPPDSGAWHGRPPLRGGCSLPEDVSLEIKQLANEAEPLAKLASELSCECFGLDLLQGLGRAGDANEAFEPFVLVCGEVLLGFALLGRLGDGPELHVHHVAVDPRERCKGHARRLLEHARRLAEQRGLQWLLAECRHHNIQYYFNLGFEVWGSRREWRKGVPPQVETQALYKLRFNVEWSLRPPAKNAHEG